MSIRRLNYTKRKKLLSKHVRIRLSPKAEEKARTFEADLQLPAGLPADAQVVVEAYRSSPAARMRFDFGTVGAVRPPPTEERRLEDFDDVLPPPLFRVKVTDTAGEPGKLLADAHQIRPIDPDEEPNRTRGILYISWKDNEGPVWELELDDPRGPQLFIDKTADPHHELPGRIEFKALVYPEVIRRVLTWILFDGQGNSVDDPESWHGFWLLFPQRAFGFSEQPPKTDSDDDTKFAWIDAVVRHCSREAQFCQALSPKEGDD